MFTASVETGLVFEWSVKYGLVPLTNGSSVHAASITQICKSPEGKILEGMFPKMKFLIERSAEDYTKEEFTGVVKHLLGQHKESIEQSVRRILSDRRGDLTSKFLGARIREAEEN